MESDSAKETVAKRPFLECAEQDLPTKSEECSASGDGDRKRERRMPTLPTPDPDGATMEGVRFVKVVKCGG